jgi:hypothetical protein
MVHTPRIQPGDAIVVSQHTVDGARRVAEVLEVIGAPDHPRYHVRWDDGHESIFFPGHDAVVEPVPHRRSPRGRQR